MTTRRIVGNNLALLAILGGNLLPASALKTALICAAGGYMGIAVVLQFRAGCRRRLPYWTRASWRAFLLACTVPSGALITLVLMLAAVELRLPIVGPAQSSTRALWILGMLGCMVLGVGGVVVAAHWMEEGDATEQFAPPRWLSWRQRDAA